MKSALADLHELMTVAFPEICKAFPRQLSERGTFRLQFALGVHRAYFLQVHGTESRFLDHLREAQTRPSTRLPSDGSSWLRLHWMQNTLSWSDSISVESNTVVERHATRWRGLRGPALAVT